MLQRRIELCGDAPRAPMQPCRRRVWPPTGGPPAQGRSPPEQAQSKKSQGVRGTESPDSFDNTPQKPRITCPFFRGKYTKRDDRAIALAHCYQIRVQRLPRFMRTGKRTAKRIRSYLIAPTSGRNR